ncbi:MAG: TAXI family TRAP transporter solute-binding subunit [Beijerinckiaceae bacterium]
MLRALLAIAGVAIAASPAAAQKYNFTVAGYSPGGLVSTIGIGMDKALAAQFPGSAVTYQTSSGGYANAILLTQKKVPIGFIGDHEMSAIMAGKPPIKRPLNNLRLLFKPYVGSTRFQISHVLARKDFAEKYGLKVFEDIAKKKPPVRVGYNRPGNSDGDVQATQFELIGVKPDDFKKWGGQLVRASSGEMASLMLDRRIDMISVGMSFNHPRVREIAKGVDVVMLPISKEIAEKTAKTWNGKLCQIKSTEYTFLAQDSWAACIGLGTYVDASMSDEAAYNITRAMFEQIDKFKSAHRLLQKVVTAQTLAEPGNVPHHPGALRYLKEKGLAK